VESFRPGGRAWSAVIGAVGLSAVGMLVALGWLVVDKGKIVVIDVKVSAAGQDVLGVGLAAVGALLLCLYFGLLKQDAADARVKAREQRAKDEEGELDDTGVLVESTAEPIPHRPPYYRLYQLIPAVLVLALDVVTAVTLL
jgi:hypothetical protein